MKNYTFKACYKFEAHGRECLLLICQDDDGAIAGIEYRGDGKAKKKTAFLGYLYDVVALEHIEADVAKGKFLWDGHKVLPCTGTERFRADKAIVLEAPFGSKNQVGIVIVPPMERRRR